MIILNIPVDQISPYQEEFFSFVSSKTKKKKVIFIAYPVLPGSRFKACPRNRRLKCPPLIRCHLKKGEGCYEQTQGVEGRNNSRTPPLPDVHIAAVLDRVTFHPLQSYYNHTV